MLDVERLRQHLAAAATCAAASLPMTACATDAGDGEGGVKGKTTSGSTLISADVSAELCDTWLKGRVDRWCTSPEQARGLAGPGDEEMGCPVSLDVTKARKERSFKRSGRGRSPGKVVLLTANAATASQDCGRATCCYLWVYDQRRYRHRYIPGRPLTDATGAAHCAPVLNEAGPWLVDLDVDVRGASSAALELAVDRWLEAARYEHASIGSFARAAAELAAMGAPADLVADCEAAARDEARHAALCFSVASALDGGTAYGPGELSPVAPREGGLAELAVAVFQEGCVGESTAALEATRASRTAKAAGQTAIADVLEQIAEDEQAHAALAWRTVAWALDVGGTEVASALEAALEALSPPDSTSRVALSEVDASGFGCLSDSARHRVEQDAYAGIVRPLTLQMVGQG